MSPRLLVFKAFVLILLSPVLIPLVLLMLLGILAGMLANPIVMWCLKNKTPGPQIRPKGYMDRGSGDLGDWVRIDPEMN